MLKKLLTKLILIGLVLIVVVAVIYVYFSTSRKEQSNLDNNDDLGNSGLEVDEGRLLSTEAPEDVFQEYMKILSFNKESYWEEWNWQTKMIHFEINEVNPSGEYVNGFIKLPDDGQLSNEPRTAHIRCPSEKTIAVAYDEPAEGDIASDFDIYSRAASGDILYTYCEDPDCLNMGKACLLVDFNYE